MEQSAQSAPPHFADPRYTPDDSAWETVVKKGNKGSKASTAPKLNPPAAPPAPTAAASQALQPQSSGLSQTGRTASGVLPSPLASQQQPGGGHSARGKSADPSSSGGGDGALSGDSASMGHRRKISQDEDTLSTRSSTVDRPLFQQPSRPQSADSSSAALQEAAGRAGLQAPAPAAKPSNWAGLLKPPQHQQQQQQQDSQQAEASSQRVAPPVVSEGAFPQLSAAAASLTPSQLGLSSEARSQGPLEADLPSMPGAPFAPAAHHAHRGSASIGSETTAESVASEQRSQVHITQQLHANAAIWGSSLAANNLSGLQLPQQQQISVNPFQAASSACSSSAAPAGLWEAQSTLAPPPSSGAPRPPSQAAPKPPVATLKSALPVNAQPFIPQAHLSSSASQGQRLPFTPQESPNQQLGSQPQAGAMPHQQGMPMSGPFMQSHSFSRPQQPPSSATGGYRSNAGFDPLPHPQQQQQNSLNRGLDGNSALQQLQHQRILQQQQQHQQATLLPRQQQQQLADIWLQPSIGLQQNASASRATGAFASHQQPPTAKGKAVPNGPFAAHQSPVAAFHQQPQQQLPFLQQQYNGLPLQPQSRSNRPGLNGSVNGNQYGSASLNGAGVNGGANGHMSSAGTQSEEDELLSGVFAKVWEDNLQVSHALCRLRVLSSQLLPCMFSFWYLVTMCHDSPPT